MFPKLLTLLYTLFAAGVAFSYIPQVLAAWRDRGRAEAISLPAWSFWTLNSAIATLYAGLIARDPHITFASGCAFLGCAATTVIVIRKRFPRLRLPVELPSPLALPAPVACEKPHVCNPCPSLIDADRG